MALTNEEIENLPEAESAIGTDWFLIVINGELYKIAPNVALGDYVPDTRIVGTGEGLVGGGNLSEDRLLYIPPEGIHYELLAPSGVTAQTVGSATQIPVLTVDDKGRVTAITTVTPTVSGYVPLTTTVTGTGGVTGGGTLNANRTFSLVGSAATPSSLGVAAPGTSAIAARDDHVHGAVDLSDSTQISSVLQPVAGGTGRSMHVNINNYGAVLYSAAGGFQMSDVGTAGYVLTSNGSDAPTWQPSGGGGGGATLTIGEGLLGGSYDGSEAVTIEIDTDVVATLAEAQTLTNKNLIDNSVFFASGSDSSKKLRTSLSDLSTDTTVTWTVQDSNGTVAYLENNLSDFANDGLTVNGELKVGTNNILGIGDIGSDSFRFGTGYFSNIDVTNPIVGDITGTAAALSPGATINGVLFDGSENITISGGSGGDTLTFGTGLTGGTYDGTAPVTAAIDTSVVVTLDGTQTLTNKTLTNPNIDELTSTDTFFTFNLAATTPGITGGFVFYQGEDQSFSFTSAILDDIGRASVSLIRPSTEIGSFVEFLGVGLGSIQFTQESSFRTSCKIITRDSEGAFYTNAQLDFENNTFFQNLLLKNETQNTIRLNAVVANEGTRAAGDIEFYADNTGISLTTLYVINATEARVPAINAAYDGVAVAVDLSIINADIHKHSATLYASAFNTTQYEAGEIEFAINNVGISQTTFFVRDTTAENPRVAALSLDSIGADFQSLQVKNAKLIDTSVTFASGSDTAKQIRLNLSDITSGQTRVYTAPDADGTLALTDSLGSYVPYTGANQNVNIGDNALLANEIYIQQLDPEEDTAILHAYVGELQVGAVYFEKNGGNDSTVFLYSSGTDGNLNTVFTANYEGITFASDAFAPTAAPGTNNTQLATTEFVTNAVAGITGLDWQTISSTTQAITVNTGYIARSATSVDFTLPTTAAIGQQFSIVYLSPNDGNLLQNAGQTIIALDQTTTEGTAGRLEGISRGEVLTILCTNTNTEFTVIGPVGNFNVV